jgi:hypothetical protein
VDEQIDSMIPEICAKLREMMIEKKKTGFRVSLFPYQVVPFFILILLFFRLHPEQRYPVHPYALGVPGPPDLYSQQHAWARTPT